MSTNFLEFSGGANGFLVSFFNVMTTELNGLGNATGATQSVAGNLNQTALGSGIWGILDFVSGGSFTPTNGGYIAGWFLLSPDSGVTFEKTSGNNDLPRPPDFIIPLFAVAYAANDFSQSSGLVRLPWWTSKIFVVNHAGVTLPSSGNVINIASVAVQY